jgi:hypothetical protein
MPKSLPCCHFLFFSADINHHTWWDRPVRSPETIQSNGYFQLRTGLQNHNPWVRTWPAIPNQYASWTLNHAEPSGQWHFIVELVPLKDLQGPIAPWHLMPAGMKDSTVHWTCRTLLCHGSLQIIPSAEILINYKKNNLARFCSNLEFLWRLEFWIRKRGMSNLVAMATSILPLLLVVSRVACEFLRFICILTNQPI